MSIFSEYFSNLKSLLKAEKAEDLKQYNDQFSRNNINYRVSKGVTWYPISISNEEFGAGDYLIVEVERTKNKDATHQFQHGKSVALFSNNQQSEGLSIQGIVKNINRDTLKIALHTDELPDWCSDGKLGINLLFDENSYREMEHCLERLSDLPKGDLHHLVGKLLGEKEPQFDESIVVEGNSSLNDSQNKAVAKSIHAQDYLLIHGPPGTGKTTTLVECIRQTVMHEKQVLVCSPSNVAIDLLCEKLSSQGIEVVRMGNPARVSEQNLSVTLDEKILKHSSYADLRSLKKRGEEFRKLASKYKRSFGPEERRQRELMYKEARAILKDAAFLEDYIVYSELEKAQVIACTLVGSANRMLKELKFMSVFIDEAGQALEPACWIPISKGKKVIFAGDHCQLPPTVKSQKAAKDGLSTTLFEKLMHRNNAAVMLNTQYRMNQKIMQFSNEKFYDGKLKSDQAVENRVLLTNDDERLSNSLVFIDTAGKGFDEQLNEESRSVSNPEEMHCMLTYLNNLLELYFEESGSSECPSIGIISPYKEQMQNIENSINNYSVLESNRKSIQIKTVDGFQGQEKDIIAISLVRSNERGEIGFLSDYRRMNVALTRARKKLIVIGDSGTLARDEFYNDFIDYAESTNSYKSAWEIQE